MPFDHREHDEQAAEDNAASPESRTTPDSVVVRRHAGVAALVGATASAVAIAYLWRAVQTSAPLDWALFGVMALIGGYYLAALVDARTPLLVADELGLRIRLGHDWRGLPWDAIGQVVVHPRRGPLRDGRIVFVPRSLARALDGLDAKGRRHVALNQRMYGAPLAVPLGTTTRLSGDDDALVADLEALVLGRADVVELDPQTLDVVDRSVAPPPERSTEGAAVTAGGTETPQDPAGTEAPTAARQQRRSILGGIGTVVSRVAKGREHDVDREALEGSEGDREATAPGPLPDADAATTAPLRETRPALRAEATISLATTGNVALDPAGDARAPLPEGRELRRPGSVDLVVEQVPLDDRVRPISTLGEPVEPLVIDDFHTEPAYDPVIGPELTAARTRLGMSVDDLAERTRIRPHVIESIEVDDFGPCGGDFYARGHLRTLARTLGKDPEPILATFEERYATAPVNARRVFEAELATGMTGSMRSTAGGPNWGLLVGVVLSLVLVWGVVRLFTTDPVDTVELQTPVLDGSAGVEGAYPVDPEPRAAPPAPVAVRLTAAQGDSTVVVRDRDGKVVFSGELVLGERKTLRVVPPVRVRAADAGAVEVRLAGRDRGPLGQSGEPGRRTYRR